MNYKIVVVGDNLNLKKIKNLDFWIEKKLFFFLKKQNL